MGDDERSDWLEQRRRAIAGHAAELERRRVAESGQARQLVADFAREALRRGLRQSELLARTYDGRGRYRTGLRGWYLRPDRSLGVSGDGEFYILTVAVPGVISALRARFTGVDLRPETPRLVVGEGARDGESMPLRALLRQRLDAGDNWP
jgi:hypothetical protein